MRIELKPGALELKVEDGPYNNALLLAAAQISTAISLKRIADVLDAWNSPNAYGEVGSAAIANSILRGLQNAR